MGNEAVDLSIRVLDALEGATRAKTQVIERVNHLEEQYSEIKDEMRTMNANLDKIARESSITNDLLRQELEAREQLEEDKKEEEKEKKEEEKEWRDLVRNVLKEAWGFINKPASVIAMAAAAYFAYTYFDIGNVPADPAPIVDVREVEDAP